jgi:hypothetical protein
VSYCHFRTEGSGLSFLDLKFRVLGFRVWGLGFEVWSLQVERFRV